MFRVINLTATSAVFTWDAPPLEDRNGIIIGYSINVTKLQTGERQELFSNSTMITVYSLQPYTVYFCISTALTSAGHGPFSDATHFETFEARKYRLQSLSKLTLNPNFEFYLHPYRLVISAMNYHVIQSMEHIQARIPNIFFWLHELYQC